MTKIQRYYSSILLNKIYNAHVNREINVKRKERKYVPYIILKTCHTIVHVDEKHCKIVDDSVNIALLYVYCMTFYCVVSVFVSFCANSTYTVSTLNR
jgi:hypothetical protein